MADQLGIGAGSGAPPSAAQLQLSLDNLRALAGLLKPGDVVSGRVDQALGGDLYAFTVRGQTVVASSAMPLTADSVLRFQVLTAADGQLALRLTNQAPTDQALTSDPAGRLRQLGLLPGLAATTVVAAFEAAGAPLHEARVQAAVALVAAAAPELVPRLAQALAVLARADLPVTAALLSLALHAERQSLPDPAAAMLAVQRAMTAGSTPILLSGSPLPLAEPLSPPVPPAQVAGSSGPATSATAESATTAPTSTAPVVSQPIVVPQSATSVALTAASLPTPSLAPANNIPSPTGAVGATPGQVAPPASAGDVGVVRSASSASVAPANAPLVEGDTSMLTASSRPLSTVALSSAAFPATALPSAVLPFFSQAEIAVRLLTHLQLPDAVNGGAVGVQQALALAGVRPRRTPGEASTPASTLVRQLAEALPAVTAAAAEAIDAMAGRGDERAASAASLNEAIIGAVREHTAETVFKPQALADYDHVVPLPLLAQGQPSPARLAVAERQTAAGTATFLRVDAELSRLGPVSVRLSGIEGGALTITLLANGASGPVLVAGLPDLAASLRQLGVVAGLRVADLAMEDGHG